MKIYKNHCIVIIIEYYSKNHMNNKYERQQWELCAIVMVAQVQAQAAANWSIDTV